MWGITVCMWKKIIFDVNWVACWREEEEKSENRVVMMLIIDCKLFSCLVWFFLYFFALSLITAVRLCNDGNFTRREREELQKKHPHTYRHNLSLWERCRGFCKETWEGTCLGTSTVIHTRNEAFDLRGNVNSQLSITNNSNQDCQWEESLLEDSSGEGGRNVLLVFWIKQKAQEMWLCCTTEWSLRGEAQGGRFTNL